MLSLKFKTINPATEGIINEYENMSYEHLDNILMNAKNAFVLWKEDFKKRADYLYAFSNEFRKNKDDLAKVATLEMGKPIRESKTEVEKCAWAMEYFADNGQIFMTDEIVNTDARKSFITFEPLGVDSKYNAMELSLLAGIKVCSSLIDSRKYYCIKTSQRYYAMWLRN